MAAFTLRKYSLEDELTPRPYCGWKDYIQEKFQGPTKGPLHMRQCLENIPVLKKEERGISEDAPLFEQHTSSSRKFGAKDSSEKLTNQSASVIS